MRLAYCVECDPPAILGVTTEMKVTVNKQTGKGEVIKDKAPVTVMPTHFIKGKTHEGKIVNVTDTPQGPGEDPTQYLARIGKKFKAKMK